MKIQSNPPAGAGNKDVGAGWFQQLARNETFDFVEDFYESGGFQSYLKGFYAVDRAAGALLKAAAWAAPNAVLMLAGAPGAGTLAQGAWRGARFLLPSALAAAGCGAKEKSLEDMGIFLTPDASEVVRETIDGEEVFYARDKVLIQVSASTPRSRVEELARQFSGEITGQIEPLHWYEIKVTDARKSLPAIRKSPLVENAELNYAARTDALDIDRNETIRVSARAHHKIKLSEAYEYIEGRDLENVTVAVLDTGFDLEHPELDSRFRDGVDVADVDFNPTYEDLPETDWTEPPGHGTMVAGLIAAENNGQDLNGVAYRAKLLPVKVVSSSRLGQIKEQTFSNSIFAFKVAAGMTYAALENADVMNVSFGWYTPEPSSLLRSAVEYAVGRDIFLTASAGNESRDAARHYPSALFGVASVGATTDNDQRADFSNYSQDEDANVLTLAAPGERVASVAAGVRGELAIDPDGYGTSFAAPFVAGAAALLKSLRPELNREDLEDFLVRSADPVMVSYPEEEESHPWRSLNVYNAVVFGLTGCNPAEAVCETGMESEGEAEAEGEAESEAEGEHDVWLPMSTEGVPEPRTSHTAVWTGSEMIVWGGSVDSNYLSTGGRYNPDTNTWTATPTASAPSSRIQHTVVWTGSEIVVWGGLENDSRRINTGAHYYPIDDHWIPMTTAGAPSPRGGHTAIWTGSEMVVWGGRNEDGRVNTGARYDLVTNTWVDTATASAPSERDGHTAVWTGSEMIVWGGDGGGPLIQTTTGGRYNPSTNTWSVTATTGVPVKRQGHTAVWTGSEMIVWGGWDGRNRLSTGGRYNPVTNTWTSTSVSGAPEARDFHTAVWTGLGMIVWGGEQSSRGPLNTGGVYNNSENRWRVTSLEEAPEPRIWHISVWTGSEMIVWGGRRSRFVSEGPPLNTGARYRP